MGCQQSLNLKYSDIMQYEVAQVRKGDFRDGKLLTLYYRPGQEILTVAANDSDRKLDENEPISPYEIFDMETVAGVSTYDDFKLNQDDSKLRISILNYNKDKQALETHNYYIAKEYTQGQPEFKKAIEAFSGLCLKTQNNQKRSMCILVNPIGGRKMSRSYFENILQPILEFNGIHYDFFETDSSTFISKFVENLNIDEALYTDFVTIGGDGVFGQLFNALMNHPDSDKLINIPIGIIPGGSSNSLACDIGCKDPFMAAINIVRGATVKVDMFKLTTADTKKSFYSTAFTYGYPAVLSVESENLRRLFGRYRYLACGTKKLVSPGSINFEADIYYKGGNDEPESPEIHSKPSFTKLESKELSESSINTPRCQETKTMTSMESEWKKLPYDNKFLFIAVVTHEIRSSINNEVFSPFAQLSGGSMYIAGLKETSRLGTLRYLKRVSDNTHLSYDRYFYQKVDELLFKVPKGSYFCVDGEPHQSSEYNIKVLPSFVTVMGKKDHVNINKFY